jgi:hypothetical protein
MSIAFLTTRQKIAFATATQNSLTTSYKGDFVLDESRQSKF